MIIKLPFKPGLITQDTPASEHFFFADLTDNSMTSMTLED